MNELQELLDGTSGTLDCDDVRQATDVALHGLRHDRRLEKLDYGQARGLASRLFHTADIRILARYSLPYPVDRLDEEAREQRRYVKKMLFEVMDEGALSDQSLLYIQRIAVSNGGQLRLAEVPYRLHIYERRFAMVAVEFDDSTAGAFAVSEPDLVASFTDLHARMWQQGRKWEQGGGGHLDLADVLGELLVGGTDEASAERLHVSLRTYRRKVQELLELLGVQSRFQAGALAEQRRYLELVRPKSRPLPATPDPYLEALAQVRSVPS